MTEADWVGAVREDPGDDACRLAYSDWLEERGEDERARFVRAQVGAARLAESLHACRCDGPGGDELECGGCVEGRRLLESLRAAEAKLLTPENFWWWFGQDSAGWVKAWPGYPAVRVRGGVCEVGYFGRAGVAPPGQWAFHFTRGFVERVDLPGDSWLAYGDALLKDFPVRDVGLAVLPKVELRYNLINAYWYFPGRPLRTIWAGSARQAALALLGEFWPGVAFHCDPERGEAPPPCSASYAGGVMVVRVEAGEDLHEGDAVGFDARGRAVRRAAGDPNRPVAGVVARAYEAGGRFVDVRVSD